MLIRGVVIRTYTEMKTLYEWYTEDLTTIPNENKSSEVNWLLSRQVVWIIQTPYHGA